MSPRLSIGFLTLAMTIGVGASFVYNPPEAHAQETKKKRRKEAEAAPVVLNAAAVAELQKIATDRKLRIEDLSAALKTYLPSGTHDEYIIFASGGHSGQVFMIGVPSMRLLRTIAVFSPEPWQGYGFPVGEEILAQGDHQGTEIRWGVPFHRRQGERALGCH